VAAGNARAALRVVAAGSQLVKGTFSSGKSVTGGTVFAHLPPLAYYALSSMSELSLAYSDEPLAHRFLILHEAAGSHHHRRPAAGGLRHVAPSRRVGCREGGVVLSIGANLGLHLNKQTDKGSLG